MSFGNNTSMVRRFSTSPTSFNYSAESSVALQALNAQKEVALINAGVDLVRHVIDTMPVRGKHLRANVYRGAFTGGVRIDVHSF